MEVASRITDTGARNVTPTCGRNWCSVAGVVTRGEALVARASQSGETSRGRRVIAGFTVADAFRQRRPLRPRSRWCTIRTDESEETRVRFQYGLGLLLALFVAVVAPLHGILPLWSKVCLST